MEQMEQTEKMKILWIDWNINRLEFLEFFPYTSEFRDEGFEIIKAENPDESDEILAKQHDFNCIILDIILQVGKKMRYREAKGGLRSGLLLLKQYVNNPELNNIKKAVFTLVDDAEIREYCQEHNILYLGKQKYTTKALVKKKY